jgi:hypothetical protein
MGDKSWIRPDNTLDMPIIFEERGHKDFGIGTPELLKGEKLRGRLSKGAKGFGVKVKGGVKKTKRRGGENFGNPASRECARGRMRERARGRMRERAKRKPSGQKERQGNILI